MEGFTEGAPFTVAVTWLPKNADGTPREVPLLNARALGPALLAETFNAGTGITTRWLVPWASVVYIKQDQPLPVPATEPTPPPPPPAPPADPKGP